MALIITLLPEKNPRFFHAQDVGIGSPYQSSCIGIHALPWAKGFYERLNMMRFDLEPEDIIDADEELFECPPRQ